MDVARSLVVLRLCGMLPVLVMCACNGQEGYGIQEMKCNSDKLKVLTT